MESLSCKSCGTTFNGKYCNECGEKVIEDKDFTLKYIFSQAFESITNLDSKFFQTFKLLIFRPGILSLKYIQGIRKPYMKPFQIFVICNLLFFIFLSEIDIFRTPSKWYFRDNFDGVNVMEQVNRIAKSRDLTVNEVAILYDKKSADLAKGLIILLIPFIGLINWLLNIKRKYPYGKHLIMAIHYFSFILLIAVLWAEFISLVFNPNKWFFIIPITSIMFFYYMFATKYFYKSSWISAILKSFTGFLLINICIQLYKVAINLLAMNTL